MFAKDLIDILACPACKGKLTLSEEGSSLLCAPCGLRFPVREGIPVMLPDEAEKVGNGERGV
ncbi:MAG TPA: Trm112 family protein [Desulfuromonadaceae bacterium]